MPVRHYRKLFHELSRSRLLKLQAAVLFFTTFIDWVLMPFLTKLEGTHLPVFMISLYMLLGASDGFVQPLFKHVRIHNIYLFVILLDLVQIFAYALVQVDIIVFTYVMLSLFTLQAITFEISRVHTIDFMKEAIDIKEYLMLRSFIVSAAIIAGSLSAMVLDYLVVRLSLTLAVLAVLGLFAILIEFKLYRKFRHLFQSGETYIVRQTNLLDKKVSVFHDEPYVPQ
jgi:hypothetical protein